MYVMCRHKIANCKKDAIFSVASFDFYGNYHITNSKNVVRRLGCARRSATFFILSLSVNFSRKYFPYPFFVQPPGYTKGKLIQRQLKNIF